MVTKIDLPENLVLAISTDTIHVNKQNGDGQLHITATTHIGDKRSTSSQEMKKNSNEPGITNYSLATEPNKKLEAIQVVMLLTVIGAEAREVFSTFAWTSKDNSAKIKPVLKKFEEYCQPCKNVPFERYRFNRRGAKTW